jgi:hypothetical protein
MALTAGMGYHANLDGLHLEVEVREEGWYYRILKVKGTLFLVDWTLPTHPSVSDYGEPENAKFDAVSRALLELRRMEADPHEVFRTTEWTKYGPGHK